MYKDLILLAIKDNSLFQSLEQNLDSKGFKIHRAVSEGEMIEIVSGKKPSLLVLDTSLEIDNSVIETVKKLKRNLTSL